MISNLTQEKSIVDELQNLEHVFYLGGSRRMAAIANETSLDMGHKFNSRISEATDYDFYATYNKNVEADLKKIGFMVNENSYEYLDDEAIMVLTKGNVQVVLRKSAEFYHAVFENIDPDFYYRCIWKSSPRLFIKKDYIRNVFNQLFKTARCGMTSEEWVKVTQSRGERAKTVKTARVGGFEHPPIQSFFDK